MKKTSYIKSLPSQIKEISDNQIRKNSAPSIFDVDEFAIFQESTNVGSNAEIRSIISPSSNGTQAIQAQAGSTQSLSQEDLATHNADANAHQALYDRLTSLSNDVQGQTNTNNDFISQITGTYLSATNLIAGSGISIANGLDINGAPTRTVSQLLTSGVISGTFYSGTYFNFSSGVNYSTGKKVLANIVNAAGSGIPLVINTHASNGSDLNFDIYPIGIGLASGTFELHWQMI